MRLEDFDNQPRGRGRPIRIPHETLLRLEKERDDRLDEQGKVESLGQMMVTDRTTHETYYVEFPLAWTYAQALEAARHYAATRGVRAWETIDLG